jgi:hypothetical protein
MSLFIPLCHDGFSMYTFNWNGFVANFYERLQKISNTESGSDLFLCIPPFQRQVTNAKIVNKPCKEISKYKLDQ